MALFVEPPVIAPSSSKSSLPTYQESFPYGVDIRGSGGKVGIIFCQHPYPPYSIGLMPGEKRGRFQEDGAQYSFYLHDSKRFLVCG
jgi:hypothetical protein